MLTRIPMSPSNPICILELRFKTKSKISKFKLNIGAVTMSRKRVELGTTQPEMPSLRIMNLRKALKDLKQGAFLREEIAIRATNMRWEITLKTTELIMDKNFKIHSNKWCTRQTDKRATLPKETKVPLDQTEMAKIAFNKMCRPRTVMDCQTANNTKYKLISKINNIWSNINKM